MLSFCCPPLIPSPSPVCPALALEADGNSLYSEALVSSKMETMRKLPSDSEFAMETSDVQRKRQFVDSEGFTHPLKFAKVCNRGQKAAALLK